MAVQTISDAGSRRFDGAAERIDYWIRRHAIRVHPAQTKSNCNSARDRLVGLSAIGQCLKDQYGALATTMPRHLAALVKQLETR